MAGDESDNDIKPSSVAIIREVYDSENAHIKFEMELERALESGIKVIVIEPEPLGEETARWIYVGNLLHKVSVYSGVCSIAAGMCEVRREGEALIELKSGNLLYYYGIKKGLHGVGFLINKEIKSLAWKSLACTPFGVVSVLCAGCYTLSWQWDPCCKYQEEKDRNNLAALPVLNDLTSATPVILVHKDNKRKVILHNTVSIAAAALCLWRLYQKFK